MPSSIDFYKEIFLRYSCSCNSSMVFLSVFFQTFELLLQLFCQLFDYEIVIIVWFFMKDHRSFRYCVQPLCIWLCNSSDHGLFSVPTDTMKSHTITFLIIIIIKINIRFWCITKLLSSIKHITITIMIIAMIINVIKSLSITIKLSDIKFLILLS